MGDEIKEIVEDALDDLKDDLEDSIRDTIEDAISDMKDDLTDEIEDIIEDSIRDAIEDAISDMKDDLTDEIEDIIEDTISNYFPEILANCLSNMEFCMKDGTIVRPVQRKRLMLVSPDKSKMLECHGGLKVDGCTLIIQTSVNSWRDIAVYRSREEAVEALQRVKDAMLSGVEIFEL